MSNNSIHPRVENNVTKFKKVNTCLTSNGEPRKRTIKALKDHLKRQPNDMQSVKHLAKLESK